MLQKKNLSNAVPAMVFFALSLFCGLFPGEVSPRRKAFYEVLMDIIETIKEQIANHPILLYMKGSPNAPQCGFSARAVQTLMACGEKFAYVDILQNPEIRANLPQYANWPTFPQLWVKGELVGGSDIILEMYESGELQPLLKEAAQSAD